MVYIITEDCLNHLTLNVLLHTQPYIYVKIAKRTVMALFQQPTYGIHILNSMFVVSTLFHGIVTRNEFEFAASRRYAYDMRKSNFPDFQGIFLYFPDLSQNLKFP